MKRRSFLKLLGISTVASAVPLLKSKHAPENIEYYYYLYNLSTPFDISTAVCAGRCARVDYIDPFADKILFNDAGTQIFIGQ